jgi:hypothetical protein
MHSPVRHKQKNLMPIGRISDPTIAVVLTGTAEYLLLISEPEPWFYTRVVLG